MLVGLLLPFVELAKSLPANLRVRKTGSADGHSDATLGILAGIVPAWIVLAELTGARPVTVACLVWGVLQWWLGAQVWQVRPAGRSTMATAAASTLGATALALALGAAVGQVEVALGIVITLATIAYALPGVRIGLTSPTTSGLSVLNLLLATLEGSVYLAAGLGLGLIAPQGEIIVGFITYGALAMLFHGSRLARTSVRRVRGIDGIAPLEITTTAEDAPLRALSA